MPRMQYDTVPGKEKGTVDVTVIGGCTLCEQPSGVQGVLVDGFIDWYRGVKQIQDALPELSDGDREILISGTHDTCFNKAFPPEGGDRTDPAAMRVIGLRARRTIFIGDGHVRGH